MNDFQNRIVGVVGRKGSGKSTRVAMLVNYCPRILAWDPMEDHSDLLPDAFEGVDDDLDEYFKQARRAKTFACSFTPVEDLEEEFEEVCRLVYDYGRMLFVVEEAPLVLKAGYMPPAFGRIVRTGRHRQIDLLWINLTGVVPASVSERFEYEVLQFSAFPHKEILPAFVSTHLFVTGTCKKAERNRETAKACTLQKRFRAQVRVQLFPVRLYGEVCKQWPQNITY